MISLTTVVVFFVSLLLLSYGVWTLRRTRNDTIFDSELPTAVGALFTLLGGIGGLIALVAGLQELYVSGITAAPWIGGALLLGGLVTAVEWSLRSR